MMEEERSQRLNQLNAFQDKWLKDSDKMIDEQNRLEKTIKECNQLTNEVSESQRAYKDHQDFLASLNGHLTADAETESVAAKVNAWQPRLKQLISNLRSSKEQLRTKYKALFYVNHDNVENTRKEILKAKTSEKLKRILFPAPFTTDSAYSAILQKNKMYYADAASFQSAVREILKKLRDLMEKERAQMTNP